MRFPDGALAMELGRWHYPSGETARDGYRYFLPRERDPLLDTYPRMSATARRRILASARRVLGDRVKTISEARLGELEVDLQALALLELARATRLAERKRHRAIDR